MSGPSHDIHIVAATTNAASCGPPILVVNAKKGPGSLRQERRFGLSGVSREDLDDVVRGLLPRDAEIAIMLAAFRAVQTKRGMTLGLPGQEDEMKAALKALGSQLLMFRQTAPQRHQGSSLPNSS